MIERQTTHQKQERVGTQQKESTEEFTSRHAPGLLTFHTNEKANFEIEDVNQDIGKVVFNRVASEDSQHPSSASKQGHQDSSIDTLRILTNLERLKQRRKASAKRKSGNQLKRHTDQIIENLRVQFNIKQIHKAN
jgi:hypothetical protein